jgi:hypothetical protein
MMQYTLVSMRDAGLPTYSWWWEDQDGRVVSPYYNSELDARGFFMSNKIVGLNRADLKKIVELLEQHKDVDPFFIEVVDVDSVSYEVIVKDAHGVEICFT